VTAITDLLTQGEDVQYLARHSSPRTMGLYDRRRESSRGTSSSGFRFDHR
jgi:hypothetical protein